MEDKSGYYGCRLSAETMYACGCPMGLECSDYNCGSVRVGECKCCSWWLWALIIFTIIAGVAVCGFFIFYFLHPIRPWVRAPKDPIERMESYARRGVPIGDSWRSVRLVQSGGSPPLVHAPLHAPNSTYHPPLAEEGLGPFGGRWSPAKQ